MDEKLRKLYDQKIDALTEELVRVAAERDKLKAANRYLFAENRRMVCDRTYVIV